MITSHEVGDTVRKAAAALFHQEGRRFPHDQPFQLEDDDLQALRDRGFLKRGVSGWEVDGEIAAVLGLAEFDYS